MTEPNSTEPETWHFIWLDGALHGTAKLTARDEDGRMRRLDSRGEWDPIPSGEGQPIWYRVSQEVAAEWVADDEDDDDWIGRP